MTLTLSNVLGLAVIAQATAGTTTNGQKTVATSTASYLLTDGHGSTRALVSSAGAVQEAYAYDAFGDMTWGEHFTSTGVASRVTADTAQTRWLFGGDGWYDPSSGFTNHDARWTNGFWFTTSDFGAAGAGNN